MNNSVLSKYFILSILTGTLVFSIYCTESYNASSGTANIPEPEYTLTGDQAHALFSRDTPPVLTVPSGSIIEAYTTEHSEEFEVIEADPDGASKIGEYFKFWFTGPVYVEGAEPGDILAVTIHDIEINDFGWTSNIPGFGLLADEFPDPYLKLFPIDKYSEVAHFTDKITIPLNPFLGVMGVAPDTDTLRTAIDPRSHGGNMDNPYYTAGTTVYLPVSVEGALFSTGDAHAAQGLGEICGTAIETAVRVVYEIEVIKGKKPIQEPHYETDQFYAVGAHATTLDEAVKKASRYMIDYLVEEHGLSRIDAYLLCSVAGDLQITEVVDIPHVWVSMHMSKEVLGI